MLVLWLKVISLRKLLVNWNWCNTLHTFYTASKYLAFTHYYCCCCCCWYGFIL